MGLSLSTTSGVVPSIPQKTGDRKAPRSPSGICLYFVTPPESNAAPTTPNLLNINHIAEEPEWN
jgi:hypothetical protein